MNAKDIIDLIISICTLIGLIGGLIPTIVLLVKKFSEIIKNKDWKSIEKLIFEAMTAVEEYAKEHPEMTSEDKLNMCLEGVEAGCEALGIKLDDDLIRDIIAEIEKLCSWSKTVNAK